MFKPIACAICLFFLFTDIMAQQHTRINLEDAIQIALDNNVQIKRSQSIIYRQEANVTRSRAEFLPTLNATLNNSRTIGRQFDQSTGIVSNQTANRIQPGFQSSITLFSGFENINNLKSSRLALSAGEDDHQRTREWVIFNTAAQFLAIILDEELLKVAEDNLETSRRQLEQVEAQVEVGMRPIVDLYNQEAAVASSELAVIQRRNALNTSKVNLVGTLQIDPFVEYDFVSPGIDDQLMEPKSYDLSELVEQAMSNRRDLRAAENSIQAQYYSLEAARGAYYPTVSLNMNLGSTYTSLQDQFNFTDQLFDVNINRGLSLNVSIPIFNRYNARTNIQQREIDYRNTQLDLESLRIEVFQEIRQAYNDYITETQQLQTTAKLELAAEKAFETEQERYNVGSSTLIELNDANNRYVAAVSERIQAQYRFIFQEKVLDFYLGRITTEDMADMLN